MTNPLISIITPSYNCAQYISEAIKSVLNQTIEEWELVIIDDGSPDNTEIIVKNFVQENPEKIFYKKISHSGLPAVARNTGIRMTRGKYIAFLDADDAWYPEKLKKTIEVFNKYPEINIITTGGTFMNTGKSYPTQNKKSVVGFNDLMKGNFFITSSVILKKRIIDNSGLFNESPALYYEDYEFWLRILLKNRGFYLREPLVSYRINENGLSQNVGGVKGNIEKQITVFKELLSHSLTIPKRILIFIKIIKLRMMCLFTKNS